MTGADLLINRRQTIAGLGAAAMFPVLGAAARSSSDFSSGRDQSFDLGWKFYKGSGEGFEAGAHDDAVWRDVDLPHDWSIEDLADQAPPNRIGPFDSTAEGRTATGFTLGGEGWYRKRFRHPVAPARAEIVFAGVYMDCDVWLNGQHLGSHVFGYTPFAFDLTPHLRHGDENVIAVRVRNLGRNSRWYSGSGIYQPVTLDVFAEDSRLARWGVAAWTRSINGDSARIHVRTHVLEVARGLTLRTRLRAASGEIAAETVSAARDEVSQTLRLRGAKLWSPADPQLYSLETELLRDDTVIDRTVQPFGVRIVAFDARRGMTINGETVKLRGGCLHHDSHPLGAASYADAEDRRVRLLKARGFNAIRSSHNPATLHLRNACDRHGMLLIQEAFDAWHRQKLPDDYSKYFEEHWREDLTAMIVSSRNSPSVIMWSIGNEISGRATAQGLEDCWRLGNEARRIDPTRPVTAGIHAFGGRLLVANSQAARPGRANRPEEAAYIFLDVAGYNYKLDEIDGDHERFPDRVIYASEYNPRDTYKYEALGARAPYMIGGFVWTAMDYLGEAGLSGSIMRATQANTTGMREIGVQVGPASFPWVAAYSGDLDLIGDQKPQSFVRDVVWDLSALEVLVQRPPLATAPQRRGPTSDLVLDESIPSWTWPGADGVEVQVQVATFGERVDVFLNGALIESKPLSPADERQVSFVIPYAPGVLEVLAYRGQTEIARKRLETLGAPARLGATIDRQTWRADRNALAFVVVDVRDSADRALSDAAVPVRLSVEGPAELIGFGSANPLAVGSFKSGEAHTFHGRALAVLRSTGQAGEARLIARSSNLTEAVAVVQGG